jgi:hypothetical protein
MFAQMRLVHVLVLVIFLVQLAEGQAPTSGTASINVQTPRVTYIAPMEPREARPVGATPSDNVGRTHIRIRAVAKELTVVVPLIARSNTSYRLVGKVVEIEGASNDPISLKSVTAAPAGTGAQLWSDATAVRGAGVVQLMPAVETLLAEGPRISRVGNNSTNDNAVVLRLTFELPVGVNSADLTFTMSPTQ